MPTRMHLRLVVTWTFALTISGHADANALLVAAFLTVVARDFVDDAAAGVLAVVRQALLRRSAEEALTTPQRRRTACVTIKDTMPVYTWSMLY